MTAHYGSTEWKDSRAHRLTALAQATDIDHARIARRTIRRAFGIEHGAEWLGLPDGTEIRYVNRGDTYDETLVFDGDEWRWSSWGDELEAAENRVFDV